MELSSELQELLTIVVTQHHDRESLVTAETLAAAVDLSPNNVRAKMRTLQALGLVEGVPGPKGGYRPTPEAYAKLDDQGFDDERVQLARDYDRLEVTVDDIDFTTVQDPERCEAVVHFRDDIGTLALGDPVLLGPTPVARLVLGGEVTAVDEAARTVTLDVGLLRAPIAEE